MGRVAELGSLGGTTRITKQHNTKDKHHETHITTPQFSRCGYLVSRRTTRLVRRTTTHRYSRADARIHGTSLPWPGCSSSSDVIPSRYHIHCAFVSDGPSGGTSDQRRQRRFLVRVASGALHHCAGRFARHAVFHIRDAGAVRGHGATAAVQRSRFHLHRRSSRHQRHAHSVV